MSKLTSNPRVGIGRRTAFRKCDILSDDVSKRSNVASQNLPQKNKNSEPGRAAACAAAATPRSVRAFEESKSPVERMHEQRRQSECMQAIDQVPAGPGQAHDSRCQQDSHDLEAH